MSLDLSRCWTEQPWVILDTETTGPDSRTCALVEVAGVRVEGRKIVAEFSELVNPGMPIPEEATAVHGIDDAMVATAPSATDVQWALDEFCMGAIPVAYNAPFDREVIRRHMEGHGLVSPALGSRMSWIDVYVIVASKRCDKFVKGPGRLKLANVCGRRGIAHESQHRALGDARATALLLLHLLENTRVKPCPLGKLLAHTDRARSEQQEDFAKWLAKQPPRAET
jgi:DNA polymerase-3 subunit epsilon